MAGRPKGTTKVQFTDEDLERLSRMAGNGLTNEQIAAIFGIHRDTFRSYVQNDERISSALEKGKAKAVEAISRACFQSAMDPKGVLDRLFWLKSRAGWREKHEIDHTIKARPIVIHKLDGSTMELTHKTEEDKDVT